MSQLELGNNGGLYSIIAGRGRDVRAKSDRHEFSEESADTLVQGLPPIVGGSGGSTWFGGGANIQQNEFELPQDLAKGFSLLYDSQCDRLGRETTVFGGSDQNGAVQLQENAGDETGVLRLYLSDRQGSRLEVQTRLSGSCAKRIAVTVLPLQHTANVYEVHSWSGRPAVPLDVDVACDGTLSRVGPEAGQFTLAGFRHNGEVTGCFTGRLANFAVFGHVLESHSVMGLSDASDNPCGLSNSLLSNPSKESLERFRKDLMILRRATAKPGLDDSDFDLVSLVIYRWLFDRNPLYVDICAQLGVQLWLPGRGPNAERLFQTISRDNPVFYAAGGSNGPLDFFWKTLDEWRSETILLAKGGDISREGFVKFVRNKLGAGHYDENDRTRWQQDLKEISDAIQIGGDRALYFQMKALADSLLQSVAATRVEQMVLL